MEGELLAVPAGAEGFVYVSNTGKRPVLADLLVSALVFFCRPQPLVAAKMPLSPAQLRAGPRVQHLHHFLAAVQTFNIPVQAVVQPIGQAAAAEATAVGSYRRSLLRSARSENSAAVTAAIAADAATALRRRPRRALLQTDSSSPATTDVLAGGSPTPSPTPAPSSSDSDSPATRDVLAGQSGNSTTPTSSPTSSTDSQNLIDRAVDRFDDPTVRKWVSFVAACKGCKLPVLQALLPRGCCILQVLRQKPPKGR